MTTKTKPSGTPIFDELRAEFRAGLHDDAIAAEAAKPEPAESAAESPSDGA